MWQVAAVDLEHQINQLSWRTVGIAALILAVCTIIALINKNRNKELKLPLFILMAGTMVITTLVLFGSTIYLNVKSESKGPVHWHADIEFWACGSELELRNPTGFLSNKIGTSTFHEHNDKRIHLEGVVVRKAEDASLEKFMRVTGGYITGSSIGIPLNEDAATYYAHEDHQDGDPQTQINLAEFVTQGTDGPVMELRNGAICPDQSRAELQVFVITYNKEDDTYVQTKVENPADYVMRDESQVPPGDCIIVEFDTPKTRTNKLCQQFGVRDSVRCTQFGVSKYNSELCNIRDVTPKAETSTQTAPESGGRPVINELPEACQNVTEESGISADCARALGIYNEEEFGAQEETR